jgi:hypothetical protein
MPQFVAAGCDDTEGMSDYTTEWQQPQPFRTPFNPKTEQDKTKRHALPWTDERKPVSSDFDVDVLPVSLSSVGVRQCAHA